MVFTYEEINMVHGLEAIKQLNEQATSNIADVRFVMCADLCEALYIDGKLVETESSAWTINIGGLAGELNGRAARITSVTLSDDWPSENGWPERYEDLAAWIDTEVE
jgi:hypothetical protein